MEVDAVERILRFYVSRLDISEQIGWYLDQGMAEDHRLVRLEFTTAFEMLDLVQVVGDEMARDFGLDEDAVHWVDVAVRESVINAIKHGNRYDTSKHVFVEFECDPRELTIRVRDQGEGFEPEEIADPLAPENLLKASGRGIFLIRSFMDDMRLERAPQGGMVVRMTKRRPAAEAVKNPAHG